MSFWNRIFGGSAHSHEEFFDSLCGKAEVIDAPKPSIRADTLRFAGHRGYAGFTDDELIEYLDRPEVPRTTILSHRLRLVRQGLIVQDDNDMNERGNKVRIYKGRAFVAFPPPIVKRETRAQLRRKLTTAELRISVLETQLAKYEKADA